MSDRGTYAWRSSGGALTCVRVVGRSKSSATVLVAGAEVSVPASQLVGYDAGLLALGDRAPCGARRPAPGYREAREAAGVPEAAAARLLGCRVGRLRALERGEASATPVLRVMMLALYDVERFREDDDGAG